MGLIAQLKAIGKETNAHVDTKLVFATIKDVKRRTHHALENQLGGVGCKSGRVSGVFVRERLPFAHDLIALAFYTYGREAEWFGADIHVGIHVPQLEIRVASLEQRLYAPDHPTFNRLIGYLMPNGRPFTRKLSRTDTTALDGATAEIANDCITYGLPYCERFASLDIILQEVKSQERQYPLRAPILLTTMGKSEAAMDQINAELVRVKSQTDAGTDSYRKKATLLLDQIAKGLWAPLKMR